MPNSPDKIVPHEFTGPVVNGERTCQYCAGTPMECSLAIGPHCAEAAEAKAARPKEQVEGLVERARKIACAGEGAPDDLGGDIVTMSLRNPDGFALLEIIEQLAALSQPSSPVSSNDPKMEKLMRQAAFSATEHKYDIPSSNEDALAAVEALAEDIRAVVFSDMGSGNRDGVLKLATELYCLRIANTLEAKPVDGEGAVEKVARAICEAGTEEPGLCFRDDDPHEAKCVRSCVACRNVARSVLEALSLSRGITLDEARERYAEEMQRGF